MLSEASVIFVTILLLKGCNALAINKGRILYRYVVDNPLFMNDIDEIEQLQ